MKGFLLTDLIWSRIDMANFRLDILLEAVPQTMPSCYGCLQYWNDVEFCLGTYVHGSKWTYGSQRNKLTSGCGGAVC